MLEGVSINENGSYWESENDNDAKAKKILINTSGRSSSVKALLSQDSSLSSSSNTAEDDESKFTTSKSNQKQRSAQNMIPTTLHNQSHETDYFSADLDKTD
jgi:hypothetical protein